MDSSNNALSFEQARNLLPDEFRPNIELTGRKKLLNTPMGLVAYHYSSLLKDGVWKTSHNEDAIRNTVDYILFAIDFEGIILLTRNVLLSFYDKNYKSRFSNNRYPIYVYKKTDRYYWKGENGERMDVTKYFYPNT